MHQDTLSVVFNSKPTEMWRIFVTSQLPDKTEEQRKRHPRLTASAVVYKSHKKILTEFSQHESGAPKRKRVSNRLKVHCFHKVIGLKVILNKYIGT